MNNVALTEIDLDGQILSVTIPDAFENADLLPQVGDNIFNQEKWKENDNIKANCEVAKQKRFPVSFSISVNAISFQIILHFLSENKCLIYWTPIKDVAIENDFVHPHWGFEPQKLTTKKETELSDIESTLIKLTDNLPLVVFEIHLFPDGRFNFGFVNKEMGIFFPEFNKEAVNQNNKLLFARVHPDDQEILLNSITKVFALNVWEVEYRVIENGQIRWVKGFGRPEIGVNGDRITAYTFLQDITIQKRQEEHLKSVIESNKKILKRLQRQQFAIEQHVNLAVVNLSSGMFEYLNYKFCVSLGYKEQDWIGKKIQQLFKPVNQDELWIDIFQILKSGNVWRDEIYFTKNNSDTIWFACSLIPYKDNLNNEKFFVFSEDISEKKNLVKKLEEEKRLFRLELLSVSFKAQEEIRILIGRELHDNINQMLVASKMTFARLKNKYPDIVEYGFQEGLSNLDGAIQGIRKLSKDLVIYNVNDVDLTQLLMEEIFNFKRNAAISTVYDVGELKSPISVDFKTHLVRILQEATTNIIKYSEATEVKILFEANEEQINLSIEDNGCGFNTKKVNQGIGLKNIQSRTSAMNGKCNIVSREGKGTFIHVFVPLI